MSRYKLIYFNINDKNFLYLKDPARTSWTTQVNVSAIVASALGGALFTLIVGLIIFFIWKRRTKRKSFTFSATSSTTPSSEPVVVPALYDLSISRRDSTRTLSYHLYDELP